METNLRLILLVVGALIIVGIILDEMRRRKHRQHNASGQSAPARTAISTAKDRTEPSFEDAMANMNAHPEAAFANTADFALSQEQTMDYDSSHYQDFDQEVYSSPRDPNAEPEVIALTVLMPEDRVLLGDDIITAASIMQLELNEYNLLSRYDYSTEQEHLLFNVASITEPGSFSFNDMDHFTTKGLLLFFTIPGTRAPVLAFEEMLRTARQLSARFNAELCDANRQELSLGDLENLRRKAQGAEHDYAVA